MSSPRPSSLRSVGSVDPKTIKIGGASPSIQPASPPPEFGAPDHAHEASKFLHSIWTSTVLHHQIGVLDRNRRNHFRNISVSTVAKAVELALNLSAQKQDAYFACAEYQSHDSREAENASSACAFWMDVDCGEEKAATGKGYRTIDDAKTAIANFCLATNLPEPTHIVDSGGGLHVYWALDQPLNRDHWQAAARKFKELAKTAGLLADPSRTADIASVLRIPGTLNHKYDPPRPVTLDHASDKRIRCASFVQAIEEAHGSNTQSIIALDKYNKARSSDQGPAPEFGPPDLAVLATALNKLDPDDDEPTWTLKRIAPLARAARNHPDLAQELFELAKDWSSGKLRGNPSNAWNTPGKGNGRTGADYFRSVWERFKNESSYAKETSLGTIYHDAENVGWEDPRKSSKRRSNATTSQTTASVEIQPVNPPKPATPLDTIQERFALVNFDGRLWVVDHQSLQSRPIDGCAKKLSLSNRADGTLLIQRQIRSEYPATDPDDVVKKFYQHPKTRCYEGVEFNPKGTSANYLNLWIGPTIVPGEGDWSLIHDFLLQVVCGGDQASYIYLISYIAHALQCPWEKPGIVIILIGGQGIGKGTLGKILRAIWDATFLNIHKIEDVTGNFNASLERSFIVFMDEALFVGDRKSSDALKSLITEPVIQINEKHQPARQTRSYHRFFAATNSEHFKNTEHDDRRDFVLKVSEDRKGDHPYWHALNHNIENGGVEAMVHDLLAMDLSGFNVRAKPDTPALVEQKLFSLGPIERWWHDALCQGVLDGNATWPDFISTAHAIVDIVEFSGGKLFRKPSPIDVVRTLTRLCTSAVKKQQQDRFERHRGLGLPTLEQARREFEHFIGGRVNWD